MICTLEEVKARLEVEAAETKYDSVITGFIALIGGRFAAECGRTFDYAAGMTMEFSGEERVLVPARYPIAAVTKWETKSSEALGWVEVVAPDYLVRGGCVVELASPIGTRLQQARMTYAGGYVMPGDTVETGQTALPEELELCAVEEVAQLWQNREKLGISAQWEANVAYKQFRKLDLLPNTVQVLAGYKRFAP